MSEQAARKPEAFEEAVGLHQPGQAEFRAILAEEHSVEAVRGVPAGGAPGSSNWPALGARHNTQVTAIGPLGLEYVDSKDDPRNHVT